MKITARGKKDGLKAVSIDYTMPTFGDKTLDKLVAGKLTITLQARMRAIARSKKSDAEKQAALKALASTPYNKLGERAQTSKTDKLVALYRELTADEREAALDACSAVDDEATN